MLSAVVTMGFGISSLLLAAGWGLVMYETDLMLDRDHVPSDHRTLTRTLLVLGVLLVIAGIAVGFLDVATQWSWILADLAGMGVAAFVRLVVRTNRYLRAFPAKEPAGDTTLSSIAMSAPDGWAVCGRTGDFRLARSAGADAATLSWRADGDEPWQTVRLDREQVSELAFAASGIALRLPDRDGQEEDPA